jgi:hypothetical protein
VLMCVGGQIDALSDKKKVHVKKRFVRVQDAPRDVHPLPTY